MRIEPWSDVLATTVPDRFGTADHWSMQQGRAQWGRLSEPTGWSHTVVLYDSDDLVAVAGGFRPRLHAGRDWCYVEVVPDRRREGIGRRALAALEVAAPPDVRPLRAKVAADSPGAHFAARSEFSQIQGNRTVWVSPAPASDPSDQVDVQVDVIAQSDSVDDSVVAAWIEFYTAGHDWDPPGEIPLGVGRELFFPVGERVVVGRRKGAIVGVACLYGSDRPTFVGGAIDRTDHDADAIANALIAATDALAPHGYDIELDDWMTDVEAALEHRTTKVIDTAFIVARPEP